MNRKFFLQLFLSLVLLSSCSCPYRYLPNYDPPQLPAFNVPQKVKIALVLGSGGVRGMVHLGILEEFEKAGIQFDLLVGCSAGSIVGALYADCPDSSKIRDAVKGLRRNSILDINLWECRFGLSQGKALSCLLNRCLEAKTFDQLKIPLVLVATDLNSGELVPLGSGSLIQAVKASCAIPLIFVPVEMHGRTLVDGGVVNPVPVCVARDLGAELIIAVDLRELLNHTFPSNLFGVAARSTEIAFLWQSEACCQGADVVIRPTLCDIGTFDASKMTMLYEAGKAAARAAIPHIHELIKERCLDTVSGPCELREARLDPYDAN